MQALFQPTRLNVLDRSDIALFSFRCKTSRTSVVLIRLLIHAYSYIRIFLSLCSSARPPAVSALWCSSKSYLVTRTCHIFRYSRTKTEQRLPGYCTAMRAPTQRRPIVTTFLLSAVVKYGPFSSSPFRFDMAYCRHYCRPRMRPGPGSDHPSNYTV